MKWTFRVAVILCVFVGLVFAPLLYARWRFAPVLPEHIEVADVAIVFGAVVREGKISPLHRQRLDAAVDLFERDLVTTVVVSNYRDAAVTMAEHLQGQGVPPGLLRLMSRPIRHRTHAWWKRRRCRAGM